MIQQLLYHVKTSFLGGFEFTLACSKFILGWKSSVLSGNTVRGHEFALSNKAEVRVRSVQADECFWSTFFYTGSLVRLQQGSFPYLFYRYICDKLSKYICNKLLFTNGATMFIPNSS